MLNHNQQFLINFFFATYTLFSARRCFAENTTTIVFSAGHRFCGTQIVKTLLETPSKNTLFGEMRGVPARWGDPARGIPTLLDPMQAEEYHEPGPLPSFEPPPPPLTPLCTSLGRARGKESPAREGVPANGFPEPWAFGRGNTTSRVPPTSRDPLPLLTFQTTKWIFGFPLSPLEPLFL